MIDSFSGKWFFLSNFAHSEIIVQALTWPTVEHAYQAAKTDVPEEIVAISRAKTPGQAKRLGREATLHPDWDNAKDAVMLRLLRIKFANEWMREHLLETGDQLLVEGNTWHDNYWGDCTCSRPTCASQGLNRLGELLMKVRDEIRGRSVAGT